MFSLPGNCLSGAYDVASLRASVLAKTIKGPLQRLVQKVVIALQSATVTRLELIRALVLRMQLLNGHVSSNRENLRCLIALAMQRCVEEMRSWKCTTDGSLAHRSCLVKGFHPIN
jgi:hypothetical protein